MSEQVEPKTRGELWTKNYILILIANFTMFVSFYMLLTTLPIYVKYLSGQETLAGLAMGIFLISSLLIRPFAGKAVDSYGRKKVLLMGLIILFICTVALNYARTLFLLFSLRFFQGFSWGLASTAAATIVSDILPKHRLAEGMGYFGLSLSIAMGVAPALALGTIERYSFNMMFNVSSFAVLFAIILAIFMTIHKEEKVNSKEISIKTVLLERSALRPSLVAFFVTLNYSSILSFIALYGADLKIDNIGIFFIIFAISITVSRPLLGRLADKKGYDIVLVPGLILMNVTMLIFYKAQTLPFFILAGIIYGIGYGAVVPTTQAMSVLNIPANRRGAANATLYLFVDLGVGLGSFIWGALAHRVGFSLMYLLAIIPILCALVFYLLFARKAKILANNR